MPKHTEDEIKEATSWFEEWASTFTREDFHDTADLRAIAEANEGVRAGQARVRELVQLARSNGRSWGRSGSRSACLDRLPASDSPPAPDVDLAESGTDP